MEIVPAYSVPWLSTEIAVATAGEVQGSSDLAACGVNAQPQSHTSHTVGGPFFGRDQGHRDMSNRQFAAISCCQGGAEMKAIAHSGMLQ